MRRIILALALAVFACGAVQAQSSVRVQAQVVGTCGGQTLTAGGFQPVTQDATGALCTNATGGGGGGGGAVTIANGADVALGSIGDAPWVSGNGTVISLLKAGNNNTAAPIPDCGSLPCTNKIGVLAPLTATSTQTKVTITTGSTYQQYLASNTSRKGCTIQFAQSNAATHVGYVFFGAAPGDTTTSFTLTPGQPMSCTNSNGTVLTDAVQLTSSNNSDVFVVNSF